MGRIEWTGIDEWLRVLGKELVEVGQDVGPRVVGTEVAETVLLNLGDLGTLDVGTLLVVVTVALVVVFTLLAGLRTARTVLASRWTYVMLFLALIGAAAALALLSEKSRDALTLRHLGLTLPVPPLVEDDWYHVEEVEDYLHSCTAAFDATLHAARLWLGVIFRTLAPLVCITIVSLFWARPYATHATREGIRIFLAQDQLHILLELGAVFLLFLLWILKKHIERQRYLERITRWYRGVKLRISTRYQGIVARVKERSMVVAALIPHLLLLVPVVVCLPYLAASVTSIWAVAFLAVVVPYIQSYRALERNIDPARRLTCVMFWTIAAVPLALVLVADNLPFASMVLSAIPRRTEMSFVALLWLLLPWTDGVSVCYRGLRVAMKRYGPSFQPPVRVSQDQRNFIVRTLIGMNVISERWADAHHDLWNFAILLVGFVFLITPTFVSALGAVYVGLLCPILFSVSAINQWRAAENPRGASREDATRMREEAENALRARLEYWMVAMPTLCLLFLFEIAGTAYWPMWYHVKVGLLLWYQFPLTAGATAVQGVLSKSLRRVLPASLTGASLSESNPPRSGERPVETPASVTGGGRTAASAVRSGNANAAKDRAVGTPSTRAPPSRTASRSAEVAESDGSGRGGYAGSDGLRKRNPLSGAAEVTPAKLLSIPVVAEEVPSSSLPPPDGDDSEYEEDEE